MSELDLQSKFPDMRPVHSAPPLWLLHGCGVTVYGRRDFDEETYTYVKTYCLCLLFLPVLALRAYRVADVQQGWAFLGRVPLSGLARVWNLLVVVGIAAGTAGILWHNHVSSPEYLAVSRLEEAQDLAAQGQLERSARLCRDVALTNADFAGQALGQLRALLDGPVQTAPAVEAAGVFRVAVALRDQPGAFPDLFERGLAVAAKREPNDPEGALLLVNAVAPTAADAKAPWPVRRRLLERIVKAQPDDPELVAQLAVVYEAQGERARCEKLLAPLRPRLGRTEGARILGQIYAQQGKFEEAHALLQPYAEARLRNLHDADKGFTEAVRQAEQRTLDLLRQNKAVGFRYDRYRQAGKEEQQAMVIQYVDAALSRDQQVKAAREALQRETDVVPVALDLGIVLLRRGQAHADPAARRRELERAEKTFLAIRGVAGQSPQYRLLLGQVYYWLGKHREGRKLFDDLLAARPDDADLLMAVSGVLREVGAISEARQMAERAYAKAPEPGKKQAVAELRSVMFTDLDDEILWLERANLADPRTRAALDLARGNKALQNGKNQEAAGHLRAAIAGYASVPENAASLNNGALAHLALYRATGERPSVDKGLALLEKAVSLRPTDSILLHNSAEALLEVALWDVLRPAIDLPLLKQSASLDLLPYLYADRAGRDRLIERLRKHAGLARAIAYLERVQVLAPKKDQTYAVLTSLHTQMHNTEALRGLWDRLKLVEVDLSDYRRQMTAYYKKTDDDKQRKSAQAAVARASEVLEGARQAGGLTRAAATANLARSKMNADVFGLPADPDELVRLAEEADKAGPSRSTQTTLVSALLFRAHGTLVRQEPAYAALATQGQRSLGPSYLVPVALTRGESLRKKVLANPDIRRAIALHKDIAGRFPDEPSSWSWALLRFSHSEQAAEVARALARDELGRLQRQVERKLSPLAASWALLSCWASQAADNDAEGQAVLRELVAQGVPFPRDGK